MKSFAEYEAAALRTAPTHSAEHAIQASQHDLLHAAMGFVTEAAELIDALKKQHAYGKALDLPNLREEVGDALWYVPLMCRARGWTMAGVLKFKTFAEFELDSRTFAAGIQPQAFRLVQGASMALKFALSQDFKQLEFTLSRFVRTLALLARSLDVSLESIALSNIDKLRVRYPEKFTAERATNRNLAAERAVLERGVK